MLMKPEFKHQNMAEMKKWEPCQYHVHEKGVACEPINRPPSTLEEAAVKRYMTTPEYLKRFGGSVAS